MMCKNPDVALQGELAAAVLIICSTCDMCQTSIASIEGWLVLICWFILAVLGEGCLCVKLSSSVSHFLIRRYFLLPCAPAQMTPFEEELD